MSYKLEEIFIREIPNYTDAKKLINLLKENDLANCILDLIQKRDEKIKKLNEEINELKYDVSEKEFLSND